jgi:NAD(P)-dependent dehydrogenase (short-subunit alcohol dehydrogenase family)
MTYKDKFNLKDKVAIITGASKGIGKDIAQALAEHGAHVIVSSRSQESIDAVVQEITELGYSAKAVACHVGKEDQLKNLVDQTISEFGGVDILINNAATNPTFEPITMTNSTVFDKVMNVNVKACMLLANLCHESMKNRGGGSIINIASVEGIKPSIGLGIYSVSKAALNMLTKVQAKEWGIDKIRSNSICPGLIKTKFSSALWENEQMLNKYVKHLPLKRMAEPDEIAGLALFLASDASSYCTGGEYSADGGYLIA